MSENISMIKYVSGDVTEEERDRRDNIDCICLVNEVHKDHGQLPPFDYVYMYSANRRIGLISPVQERQSLLERFISLPGNPESDEVPARSSGEILVSFYNYELPLRVEPDDESSGDRQEARRGSSATLLEDREAQNPFCLPVPLQYLYNFPNNGAEMINKEALLKLVPGNFVIGANLRIMYVAGIQFGQILMKRCVN